MKNTQQIQAKNFFERDARNWSLKSDFKKNKILNTIQARNLFVLKIIKQFKLKYHLDVGCGSGDLSYVSSKVTNKSIGLDFAQSMIDIAGRKFSRKNLNFECKSVFNYQPNSVFDVISANGFIEYLSINQIKNFIKFCKKNLKKNGFLILGSRNRLYNLFSLNEFSNKEVHKETFKKFYIESINLAKLNLTNFLKCRKINFGQVPFKQSKNVINVDKRHQFSPSQLINLLGKYSFKTIEISPINYHPVIPKIYNSSINYKKISNFILTDKNKLALIPFASSFMIAVRKN